MNKIIFTLMLISTFSIKSFAEDNVLKENSIGMVDMQRIISESTAAKTLKDAAEKKSLEYEKEAKKLEDSLSKNNQELSRQKSVLSEEAYAERIREFENKIVEAQRTTQMKKIKLAQAFENGLANISNVVTDIVGDIAKAKQFTLVIPSTGLLYAKDNLDITSEVLEKLNSKLPSISLKMEQHEDTKAKHTK